jgi:hypothetical protein
MIRTALGLMICCISANPPAPAGATCIADVPHIRQLPDFCGEACAEMWLRKLGHQMDQKYVFNRSGLAPALGRGCHTAELKRSLEAIGLKPGATWYQVEADSAAEGMERNWKLLLDDLRRGIPSMVCMRYTDPPGDSEHFRLVLGYDEDKDEVIYHEPAEADGAYRRSARQRFLDLWPLKYNERTWTLIRLRMESGRIEKPAEFPSPSDAEYAQHVQSLVARIKEKLPGAVFHVAVQKPFVVVGDEAPDTVRTRAVRTVQWAGDHLTSEYFPKPPDGIYDVWLFKDKESYARGAKALFGEEPHTPFGYCSSQNRALVMNIATGGGTLVHEMVHAFMRSNFPECPAWFNEGLASLYEQCGEKDGRIWGYPNWRLPGLVKLIRSGKLPAFKELCSTTTAEFYAGAGGDGYAQARYLCLYLQEKGLLRTYYTEFAKSARDDPTGYQTLLKVLGLKTEEDIARFRRQWEEFVLALRRS